MADDGAHGQAAAVGRGRLPHPPDADGHLPHAWLGAAAGELDVRHREAGAGVDGHVLPPAQALVEVGPVLDRVTGEAPGGCRAHH